ncbi:hypothetical protein BDY21DRAFT_370581 [Lineolata rhizophorae]|uniref:Uncharacterized protein n=1 Tax=Lineolata rhizophorae TaxID=578093 RepID=A0A6A6P5N4_9PEZI|nr:hypothetical protein BDY21DRAFT_370581 [Lineolata rhizophorae]
MPVRRKHKIISTNLPGRRTDPTILPNSILVELQMPVEATRPPEDLKQLHSFLMDTALHWAWLRLREVGGEDISDAFLNKVATPYRDWALRVGLHAGRISKWTFIERFDLRCYLVMFIKNIHHFQLEVLKAETECKAAQTKVELKDLELAIEFLQTDVHIIESYNTRGSSENGDFAYHESKRRQEQMRIAHPVGLESFEEVLDLLDRLEKAKERLNRLLEMQNKGSNTMTGLAEP